jgi:uncharacterized protein (TIGR03435 family)
MPIRLFALTLIAVTGALGQEPSFEAAALKVDDSGVPVQRLEYLPGGQVALRHATLGELIAEAWHLRPEQVSGIPAAYKELRYNIFAKTPPRTLHADARRMLQSLLMERFQLVHHEEQREMKVYLLIAAKKGLKLTPAANADGESTCNSQDVSKGLVHFLCANLTLDALTRWLPKIAPLYADLPVVDATQTPGAFDFKLDWAPRVNMMLGSHDTSQFDGNGPTLPEVLESQYGLKLETRKQLMPFLVISGVGKAVTEN